MKYTISVAIWYIDLLHASEIFVILCIQLLSPGLQKDITLYSFMDGNNVNENLIAQVHEFSDREPGRTPKRHTDMKFHGWNSSKQKIVYPTRGDLVTIYHYSTHALCHNHFRSGVCKPGGSSKHITFKASCKLKRNRHQFRSCRPPGNSVCNCGLVLVVFFKETASLSQVVCVLVVFLWNIINFVSGLGVRSWSHTHDTANGTA